MVVFIINIVYMAFLFIVSRCINRRSLIYFPILGYFIIFLGPINYIYWGGEVYRSFSKEAEWYFIYLTLINFSFLVVFIVCSSFFYNRVVSYNYINSSVWLNRFSVFIIFSSIFYFIFYFDQWPILKVLSNSDWQRPDIVKGEFEGYFFMSVVFQLILPAIFFHYFQRQKRQVLLALLLFFCCFFLVIGGNKGILFYFFIFLFFISLKKAPFKIIFISTIGLMFFYSLMKGVEFNYENLTSYLIESIFRRVFVTQGMASPNILQMMLDDVDFSNFDSNGLKYQLFYKVYNYTPGSMPIYYTVEAYVRYGLLFCIFIGLFFAIFLAFFISLIERLGLLSVTWCMFYFNYILLMSGISEANMYRTAMVLVVSFVFYYFSFYQNRRSR